MPDEILLKGINFHGTMSALERRAGKDVLARALAQVPGPAGEALRTGEIVSGGWYPASHYDALLAGIEAALPEERGILRNLAREAVTHDFATLFKLISLVLSPETALTSAVKVVQRYVKGGKIAVVSAREGHIHFRFDEFTGYTRRLWDDFTGGMEATLVMMKVKPLAPRVIAGGGDDPFFEVIMRYSR